MFRAITNIFAKEDKAAEILRVRKEKQRMIEESRAQSEPNYKKNQDELSKKQTIREETRLKASEEYAKKSSESKSVTPVADDRVIETLQKKDLIDQIQNRYSPVVTKDSKAETKVETTVDSKTTSQIRAKLNQKFEAFKTLQADTSEYFGYRNVKKYQYRKDHAVAHQADFAHRVEQYFVMINANRKNHLARKLSLLAPKTETPATSVEPTVVIQSPRSPGKTA